MNKTTNLRELLSRIIKDVRGVPISTEDKCRVPAALYNVSLEHANSIAVLIDCKFYSSASALIRPMLEAYVRASWIFNCASEKEISDFVADDRFYKKIPAMLADLDGTRKLEGYLVRLGGNITELHSYTHGGQMVISRNLTENEVASSFTNAEVSDMLAFASLISFLSYTGLSELAKLSNSAEVEGMLAWVESWIGAE